MDKGFTVPKWVLINWPKITQMRQKFSAQFACPSTKIWDFRKKDFYGCPKSVYKMIKFKARMIISLDLI